PEIDRNATIAENWGMRGRYARFYNVQIDAVYDPYPYRVKMTISHDGRPHVADNVPWGNYEEMWIFCPSTLDSGVRDPDKRPLTRPSVGANGILYMTPEFVDGLVLVPDNLALPNGKWPRELSGDDVVMNGLSVNLLSVMLHAGYFEKGRFVP